MVCNFLRARSVWWDEDHIVKGQIMRFPNYKFGEGRIYSNRDKRIPTDEVTKTKREKRIENKRTVSS